eukprot:1014176-Prorocentrum_minimum.AAC.1
MTGGGFAGGGEGGEISCERTGFPTIGMTTPSSCETAGISKLPSRDWFALREYPTSPHVIGLHCRNIPSRLAKPPSRAANSSTPHLDLTQLDST